MFFWTLILANNFIEKMINYSVIVNLIVKFIIRIQHQEKRCGWYTKQTVFFFHADTQLPLIPEIFSKSSKSKKKITKTNGRQERQ